MQHITSRIAFTLSIVLTFSIVSAADKPRNISRQANESKVVNTTTVAASKDSRSPRMSITSAVKNVIADRDEFDGKLRNAVMIVIQQHPETTCWSGTEGNRIFSVVAIAIPDGKPQSQIRQALRVQCGIQVIAELLTAKSLLVLYQSERLDDVTTLKAAVRASFSVLESTGKLQITAQRIAIQDQFVIGIAVADRDKIIATLLAPTQKEIVKSAYRDIMHHQAVAMMEKEQWTDALAFWRHLHQRRLVSTRLYLDAATCFIKLEKKDEAVRIAREAIDKYPKANDAYFYEQLGNILLLDPGNEESQQAAVKAFERANELFDARYEK